MKKLVKRTAAVALTGVMAAGMLTGCGEKEVDGTKIAATVNKTEVPLGVVSLYARVQQAQTDAMYKSFMGTGANMWDDPVEEGAEETYGEKLVSDSVDAVELMMIQKEKAADYGVEVTQEEQDKIAEAAKAFVEDNGEEVMKELAVTEDQIKMLLELQTYRAKIFDPIVAEGNLEVTDDEATQSSFSFVNVSAMDEGLTEEESEKKKEQAQEILDKMKEDPAQDMTEAAQSVDQAYTALTGKFVVKKGEDTEDSYPEEVMEVLRTLKEGELSQELIETEEGYYIVRLDKAFDEEATEAKRSMLLEEKEQEYYQEICDQWMEEAEITEDAKVLKSLTITNAHTFVMKAPEAQMPVTDAVEVETEEPVIETEEAEGTEEVTAAEDAELEETEE